VTGFIKLDRDMQKNFLWTSEPFSKAQAWIDMIMYANFKKNRVLHRGEFIELKRGEFFTSDSFLAERWGWSRNKVRGFIQLLIDEHMISVKRYSRRTVINVLNYCIYQDTKEQQGTAESTTVIHQWN
jgi:DNA replication protein DnaD